jgi:tRNA-splicing ligase RtcB
MVSRKDLNQLSEYLYEIPTSFRQDMRVPAHLYINETLLDLALEDRSLEQLVNTTTLPGAVKYTLAMPDMHQGYGFSIGGVAATKLPDGVISPGGVGYDINCGVRLLISDIDANAVRDQMTSLMDALYSQVPSGLGQGGELRLSKKDMDRLLEQGSGWVVHNLGYGTEQDLDHTEERGALAGANPDAVSQHARDRARTQLGTLGSGNHFLEVDQVVEIYDEDTARALGLRRGQLAVQIHSGSRALGHQVCSDHVRKLQEAMRTYEYKLPDRELACVPFDSPEGKAYYGAMACAANFAWANRQVMMHLTRQVFDRVLAGVTQDRSLRLVYDVAHNMAKVEEHVLDGKTQTLCVHRKGATRAFPPSSPQLPPEYQETGQPVLIPGSMGTASYVLVGTETAMEKSFGSTCHGAGRTMSRRAAKRKVWGADLRKQLEQDGIAVRTDSMAGLAEEAPVAYKDVHEVIQVVDGAGLSKKVARLEPLGVMKG